MEWIVTQGIVGFMKKIKCLWLEINSWGIKECGGRITDLVQENRLRLRKSKIIRDLARRWNAFKSMQITDKGKRISWKNKTMCFTARQKISYRDKTLKNLYKLSKSTKLLENVLKYVCKKQ